MEDTKLTLEQMEEELIKEESDQLDELLDEFLKEPLPAFEEPDTTVAAEEPVVYRNFSNDYGAQPPEPTQEDLQAEEESAAQRRKRENDDRTIVALMAVASVECLGILAILAYWIKMFL